MFIKPDFNVNKVAFMKNPPSLKSHGPEYESVFSRRVCILGFKVWNQWGIGGILPEIEILEKFFLKKYHNDFAQILNFFAFAAPIGTGTGDIFTYFVFFGSKLQGGGFLLIISKKI